MYFSIRSITQPTICSKNLPLGDRTAPLRPQLPATLKASSQELSTPLANTHMSSMYTYISPKANRALETVPAIPPSIVQSQHQYSCFYCITQGRTSLHVCIYCYFIHGLTLVIKASVFTLMHDNSYKRSMYLAAKQKKYKKPKHKKRGDVSVATMTSPLQLGAVDHNLIWIQFYFFNITSTTAGA